MFHKGPKIYSRNGYSGSLWIDVARHEILRTEIRAVEIDPKYPFRIMEQNIDYGHVQAGDLSDLFIPLRSETIDCARAYPVCRRNVLEFSNWRKFVVKSTILPAAR